MFRAPVFAAEAPQKKRKLVFNGCFCHGYDFDRASRGNVMFQCIEAGKVKEVRHLVEDHGLSINEMNRATGETPLIAAIRAKQHSVFRYIVSRKEADLNAGTEKITPLIYCLINKADDALFDVLVQDRRTNLEARSPTVWLAAGVTALSLALPFFATSRAEKLLQWGAVIANIDLPRHPAGLAPREYAYYGLQIATPDWSPATHWRVQPDLQRTIKTWLLVCLRWKQTGVRVLYHDIRILIAQCVAREWKKDSRDVILGDIGARIKTVVSFG